MRSAVVECPTHDHLVSGSNPLAGIIYLCVVDDTDHCVLIPDIQQFLRRMTNTGGRSKMRSENGSICSGCVSYVGDKFYDDHREKCVALSKGFRIIMPKSGGKFKFKDHAATEMAPFVAF